MHRALLELTVHGVETSRDFHLRVMEDDEFRRGDIEIQWLERRLPSLVRSQPPREALRVAAVAAALVAHRDRSVSGAGMSNGKGSTAAASAARDGAAPDGWKQAARREAVGDRW